MADLCTFWGTLATFTVQGATNAISSMNVISMSGLDVSVLTLSEDSFSSASGYSKKCFAPIKDHTPIRMQGYFDPAIFSAALSAVVAHSTATGSPDTLAISWSNVGGATLTIVGKVSRAAMDENTVDARPTMTIEFQMGAHSAPTYA